MSLTPISPTDAARLIESGALLFDIRPEDERARLTIDAARPMALDRLAPVAGAQSVIFHCRSGMRTQANAGALAACSEGEAYFIEGGIEGWRQAGLPVRIDTGQPIELMRQVQIAAGALILIGVALGFALSPLWFGLAGFIGAGLTMAGVTGWCGMAQVLARMPWNRRAA
ncbi:MAG: hypothetical protein B7Z08_07910 [Sphingomonadales bacterium 32-68-7]|nr:MAG: hypothetical protein B7Z33_09915 [Sphingomonadales bacterium 12-68-11]OYX08794.1 MAG: hypothetical protein B7Z08_07910 [Sphingomonadales bacterium 32-68-7]